jgi:hypothetical protein
VEIIAEEVSTKRRETYGYTAEQIVSKVEHDGSAIAILNHILRATNPFELERLLTKVIPQRYFESHAFSEDSSGGSVLLSLETCFRAAFDIVPDEVKTRVTRRYVTILCEDSEIDVFLYEKAFFKGKEGVSQPL